MRRARRDETPGHLPERPRGRVAEREPPHGAVDPVGPDEEVVLAAGAVAELGLDLPVALGEAIQRHARADRRVIGSLAQHVVQRRAMERETRSDAGPQPSDVDVGEQPAVVVKEALSRDLDCSLGNLGLEAERAQSASGVPGQVDAGSGVWRRRFALDDLGREAGAGERPCRGETGDAGAHHEHP